MTTRPAGVVLLFLICSSGETHAFAAHRELSGAVPTDGRHGALTGETRGARPGAGAPPPQLREKYFQQTLDHFNFNSYGNGTFLQRYLIADQYWDKGFGPIFFYTGNEGDIWDFARNSGFIMELAAEQRALAIFAEHRYYGKSLPFGEQSFATPRIGLLTAEQALADYAVLIAGLRGQLGATACPVIAFGGSYGGMLSAYMRLRYPNIVAGALAASAPVLSTAGLGDPKQFFRDVTSDFERYRPACKDTVRKAFRSLIDLSRAQDYRRIKEEFSLCKTPSSEKDMRQMYGFLRNAFTLMAMLDYPYSTHFIGNLPANPVKVACDTMLNGTDVLRALRDAVGKLASVLPRQENPASCLEPSVERFQ